MFEKIVSMFRYLKSAVPFRLVPALIATLVLIGLLLTPVPAGLDTKAWQLVAIFLTTIVAIILKVMPIGVMALMAIVIVSLSQVTSSSSKGAITDALSSFANPLIWLIVVAVLISRGLKKTGLGSRIGLMFIALLVAAVAMGLYLSGYIVLMMLKLHGFFRADFRKCTCL